MTDNEWGDPISGGDVWDLAKDGPLVGVYTGYKEVPTKFGPARLHSFHTDRGVQKCWGKTDLNNKLDKRENELVKVVLTDERIDTGAGNPMIVFEVFSKGPQEPPADEPF